MAFTYYATDGKLGVNTGESDGSTPQFDDRTVGIFNNQIAGIYGRAASTMVGGTTVTTSTNGFFTSASAGAYVLMPSVSVTTSTYCWAAQVATFPS